MSRLTILGFFAAVVAIARPAGATPGDLALPNPSAVVESVEVSGEVSGNWARLAVSCRVALAVDGPDWVPIHLDGLPLSGVREGSVDLPTRMAPAESRGWQVELKGKGIHGVRVDLLAPVRSTAEGKRVELIIPPAASTRFDLIVPNAVIDAGTGPDEPVALAPAPDRRGVRLSARLSPRPRINLVWHERVDPSNTLPTLLWAQGEIAMEVERGSIRSRSSWVVTSIRGTTGLLAVRIDPAEELIDVAVDHKPVQVETRREGGRSVVSIPLDEPLRTNAARSVVLNTRRPIASAGTVRVALQGYSFDQARVQNGLIAVSRAGPIYLSPTPGRGLRRIDPRTELPEGLRGRPETTLAFEFNDQPFDLGLEVEPAPPRLRVTTRTTVTLDPRSAQIQSKLDILASQGKVFEIKVDLPPGLGFDGAEPPEVVESVRVVPLDPEAAASSGVDVPRVATITLTPTARESGDFKIVLKGWAAIDPSKPVALPTFRPRSDLGEGARFAIVTDRNVSVEPAGLGDEAPAFRVDWGASPVDWPWPARRPGPELGLLWLRSDANPETIPLAVTTHPRTIRHESTLSASIDPKGVEVEEVIAVQVAFGVASRLDLALPPGVPDHWEVKGVEVSRRDLMGSDTGGTRRFRLQFAREQSGGFELRVRYRLPFETGPTPERLRLEPIRVLEGNSTGRRVEVAADSRFEIKTEAKGWETASPSASGAGGTNPRLTLASGEERPGPVDLLVMAGSKSPIPEVVVPRLWIRTVERPEEDLATSARFLVESQAGSMTVGLPPGSRWVRVRVGGSDLPAGNVDRPNPDELRLRFPSPTATGGVVVAIDFVVPASAASNPNGWPTIRLLGGGVVQQTLWEVQVPGSRAGIGTPSGWTDENEWYWAGFLWRRRPVQSPAELADWLTGGVARHRPDETIDPASAGLQVYLFGRVGPPEPLRLPIIGRIGLLLICSGPVLAAGLLVLARRPPPRLIGGSLLILAFAAGSWFEPNVLILAVQSSMLGFVLWLSALAMNWAIEKAGHPRGTRDGAGALLVATTPPASATVRPPPTPGSDDSTAIRPRPAHPSAASTADHIVLIRPPEVD